MKKWEETEYQVQNWLKNNPLFKGMIIKKLKDGVEGVDLEAFYEHDLESKIAIQVKSWEQDIQLKDIFTFLETLKKPENNYSQGILITKDKGKLTNSAKEKISKYKKENNIKIEIFENPNLKEYQKNSQTFQLRPYQKEAIEAAKEHYRFNDRGILEMACGTGKTFVAKNIIKNLLPEGGLVFFFAPWLSLLEQSIRYLTADDNETLVIPVCSTEDEMISKNNKSLNTEDLNKSHIINLEHLLEKDNLNSFRKKFKYIIVFCTYRSQDRLAEKQEKEILGKTDLIICDEKLIIL